MTPSPPPTPKRPARRSTPRDFAAVAVAALTTSAHEGAVYRMTGSQSLTHAEQISAIGTAIGRELRFEEITPAQAAEAMGPYAPAEVLLADWAEHLHRPVPNSGVVEAVTGRPARTFAQWAADYATDFTA